LQQRGLSLTLHVADFQQLPVATGTTGLILCCDNSLPHLQSPAAILSALREWYRCLKPDGGCLISMRDYDDPPPPGTVEERPYGERTWKGRRYMVRQIWTWAGPRYDVTLDMTGLEADAPALPPITTSYLAIAVADVARLMTEAGFSGVVSLDDRLFQPVLVGIKPPVPNVRGS
jgi:SAM-dependent methyltransferase